MNQFLTLHEVSLPRIIDLAGKAKRTFTYAVRPIYGANQLNKIIHIGSSVAISVDDNKYLITAAHVLDNNDVTTLYAAGRKNLIKLEMTFETTTKIQNDRRKDHFDFAFGKLSDKDLKALGEIVFVSETDLFKGYSFADGHVFTSMGYPNSKNKKHDDVGKSVRPRIFTYTNLSSKSSDLPKKLDLTPKSHLYIHYDDKYALTLDGKKTNALKLTGMSGGGIFIIGNLADPEVLSGSVAPHLRLAAIFTEYHKDAKTILATPMRYIINTIKKYDS